MPDKVKNTEKIAKSVHTVTDPITTPIKKVQKSFLRHIPKIILYPLELFILFLIILFFFLQTNTFNRWALNYTLKKLNNSFVEKESSVYAESLRGNIFSGLDLIDAGIKVASDTLIRFDTLSIKYDILGLLRDKIVVSQLTIQNPKGAISKLIDKNGNIIWNFEYLLSKEEIKEDTIKNPFNWGIEVENLNIHNGNFRILDSNLTKSSLNQIKVQHSNNFNLGNLYVTNFELSLKTRYFSDFKSISLNNLSFKTNSDFELKKLSFDAILSPKDSVAEIKNLQIITPRSDVSAPIILLTGFNPLDSVNYFNFKNDKVKLELHIKKFNMLDLIFFLPSLNFLSGIVSLDLEADGTYGELNIKNLKLKSPESIINLKGKVKNLNDPSKLTFDISGKDLVLDPLDTKYLLPGISIPDYSHIGKVNLDFSYIGEPLNFSSGFNIRTGFGNAEGDISLNLINPPDFIYKANLQTSNLNFGGIINNKDLESSVNMKTDISGTGFDINRMNARINYELSNSRFYNFNINKSAGAVDINARNISGELSLSTDEIETNVKGKINLDKLQDAEYSMKGNARNLDLSKFTKNSSDRSNLNFSFDVNGRGASLDNIEGNYDFNFQNSYYSSYFIPSTPVDIKMSKSKSNTDLTVNTDFFDMKASGSFDLKDIADALIYNTNLLKEEFSGKLANDTSINLYAKELHPKILHEFNFGYEFVTKDIKPLTKLFDSAGIKFQGGIKGKMSNSSSGFNSSTDLDITNFNYLDSLFSLKNIKGFVDFNNDYSKSDLKPYDKLYPISASIDLKGDKVKFSGSSFDSLSLKLRAENSIQNFSLKGGKDSTFFVDFSGTSRLGNWLHFTFDTLFVRYNKFLINNNGKLVVVYKPSSTQKTISFQQFNINNNLVNFKMSGDLSFAGKSNLDIEAKINRVASLIDVLFPPDTINNRYARSKYQSPVKGSIRRLALHLEGDKENPVLGIEMNTGLLRYENIKVGSIDAFIDYNHSVLSTDVLLSNAEGNGKMRLNGDIPLVNPFIQGEERVNTSISDFPVDFKLNANNFQLGFFSKLIPDLADLRGLLNGDISATGTVAKPILNGNLDVTKGRFLLGITGLYHRFTAKLRAENSNLVVDNFKILNLNDNSRHLDFWGRINFEGLSVKDIDLSSTGDVVVLDESANENSFGMTGNMVVGTGNPPIRIHGNLERLYIDGQLLIKDANVKFSSIPTSPYDVSADNFVYRILRDTSNPSFRDTVIVVPPEKFNEVDPFLREFIVSSSIPKKKTQTNIVYNLNVRTQKNAIVSVVFNPLTSEELFGEMQADIEMNNNTGQMQLYGNVDIVGDSYYRYYRVFKVKDSRLTFLGASDNPSLNIQAVYESKTTSSTSLVNNENQGTKIILEIKGTKLKPELSLRLVENGSEETGPDAQSDAISYLIFGVSKNQLSTGQQSSLVRNFGASTGSNLIASMLNSALRDIAPFILNTELNYSEGNIATGTDLRITSAIGDAVVRVGGKVFSGFENTEFDIEYPLNKLLNMNISNNLVLELSRTIDENGLMGGRSVYTGVKLSYKIRY